MPGFEFKRVELPDGRPGWKFAGHVLSVVKQGKILPRISAYYLECSCGQRLELSQDPRIDADGELREAMTTHFMLVLDERLDTTERHSRLHRDDGSELLA